MFSKTILYYVCIRTHNAGCSFEPIFMKFIPSVRVHPQVNPIVFGNNRPNRSTVLDITYVTLKSENMKTNHLRIDTTITKSNNFDFVIVLSSCCFSFGFSHFVIVQISNINNCKSSKNIINFHSFSANINFS